MKKFLSCLVFSLLIFASLWLISSADDYTGLAQADLYYYSGTGTANDHTNYDSGYDLPIYYSLQNDYSYYYSGVLQFRVPVYLIFPGSDLAHTTVYSTIGSYENPMNTLVFYFSSYDEDYQQIENVEISSSSYAKFTFKRVLSGYEIDPTLFIGLDYEHYLLTMDSWKKNFQTAFIEITCDYKSFPTGHDSAAAWLLSWAKGGYKKFDQFSMRRRDPADPNVTGHDFSALSKRSQWYLLSGEYVTGKTDAQIQSMIDNYFKSEQLYDYLANTFDVSDFDIDEVKPFFSSFWRTFITNIPEVAMIVSLLCGAIFLLFLVKFKL